MHILLVDDDSSRWILASFLREAGHKLTVCSNGGDAVEQFASRDFDLLITDVKMPDMSGFELLNKLKRIPGKPMPEVVVCTACTGPDLIKELGREGVYKVIIKPIHVQELMAVLKNIELRIGGSGKEENYPGRL